MNRNVLAVIVVALVVIVGVLGYRLYQEQNTSGIDIEVGEGGVSIEAN
jgi:predicted negative regulator of RcsB-dependent stress response